MNLKEFLKNYKKTIIDASIASLILSLCSFLMIILVLIDDIKNVEYYGQSLSIINDQIHKAMPRIIFTASITSICIMICLFMIVALLELKILYKFRFFHKQKKRSKTRINKSDTNRNPSERKELLADMKKIYTKYRRNILNAFLFGSIYGFNFALLYTYTKTAGIISKTYHIQPVSLRSRILLEHTTPNILITAAIIFIIASIVCFAMRLIVNFRREYNIYVIYEIKRYFKEKRTSKADQKNSTEDNDTNADN